MEHQNEAARIHRGFVKILAFSYLFAGLLHGLDIFDARLKFSEMDLLWQSWTLYLAFADTIAAFSLWFCARSGELMFVAIVLSQLAVYLGWSEYFGSQYAWIAFHLVTLSVYLLVLTYKNRDDAINGRTGEIG